MKQTYKVYSSLFFMAGRVAIILCSGGLDSVTTAYYVSKKLDYGKVKVLFFKYGQRSLQSERKFSKICARDLKADFIEINLDELSKISNSLINKKSSWNKLSVKDLKNTKQESLNWYVPCRNTIFLIYALALAESLLISGEKECDIFIGFKNEGKDSYPDATKGFLEVMNKVQKVSINKNIKILAPFINFDKEDIVFEGVKLGINYKNTFSCYTGKNRHCGSCLACRLRQEGFYWAGIKDPTIYREKMRDYRLAK